MYVLGVETSCDDTGIGLYDSDRQTVYHEVYTQKTHENYGGVVPELASREHIQKLYPLLKRVLKKSGLGSLQALQGVAYTAGPGLSVALTTGTVFARSLAFALGIPAVAVHHLEGHLLTPLLEKKAPAFAFLALLVSGGHTQIIQVNGWGDYITLGRTLDDAAGEAFDKTGKLLGLGYPAGAALSRLALSGNPDRFVFSQPLKHSKRLDFSFSGLKTQVASAYNNACKDRSEASLKADIAASFEKTMIKTLSAVCKRGLEKTGLNRLVVCGGVSANQKLQKALSTLMAEREGEVYFPPPALCTDNGAMIAFAGWHYLSRGKQNGLEMAIYPRWPLEAGQVL